MKLALRALCPLGGGFGFPTPHPGGDTNQVTLRRDCFDRRQSPMRFRVASFLVASVVSFPLAGCSAGQEDGDAFESADQAIVKKRAYEWSGRSSHTEQVTSAWVYYSDDRSGRPYISDSYTDEGKPITRYSAGTAKAFLTIEVDSASKKIVARRVGGHFTDVNLELTGSVLSGVTNTDDGGFVSVGIADPTGNSRLVVKTKEIERKEQRWLFPEEIRQHFGSNKLCSCFGAYLTETIVRETSFESGIRMRMSGGVPMRDVRTNEILWTTDPLPGPSIDLF